MFEKTKKYVKIKSNFQRNTTFVIHWDGKLLYYLTRKEMVERLKVFFSGKGASELMTVPKNLLQQDKLRQ